MTLLSHPLWLSLFKNPPVHFHKPGTAIPYRSSRLQVGQEVQLETSNARARTTGYGQQDPIFGGVFLVA